jgi:uncharacterized membrane protein YqaE (UPF0057 family)
MKKIVLLFTMFLVIASASIQATVNVKKIPTDVQALNVQKSALGSEFQNFDLDQFLNLTPKEYKKMTGERLGLKKSVQLKAAQIALKKELNKAGGTAGDGITKGLYILLAFFGLGWIAMGVKSDWDGSDWIVNLILTALCWLPGFIHALVKMKNYYK